MAGMSPVSGKPASCRGAKVRPPAAASLLTIHVAGGRPRARNSSAFQRGAPGASGSCGCAADGAQLSRQRSRAALGWGALGALVATWFTFLPSFVFILAGGDLLKIDMNMPFRVVDIFSGVILLCLIASEVFVRNRVQWGKR